MKRNEVPVVHITSTSSGNNIVVDYLLWDAQGRGTAAGPDAHDADERDRHLPYLFQLPRPAAAVAADRHAPVHGQQGQVPQVAAARRARTPGELLAEGISKRCAGTSGQPI
jgi:hypothetical protein